MDIALARMEVKHFGQSSFDGGVRWHFLKLSRPVTREEIEAYCESYNITLYAWGPNLPGAIFFEAADIKIGKHHALVTRRYGYDV